MLKKSKILLVFLIAFIFLLTGCGEKTPITVDKFVSTMDNMGFVVSDEKDEREEYAYMISVFVGADPDHVIVHYDEETIYEEGEEKKILSKEYDPNYQIEFYVFDTEANAIGFYNNNKAIFESEKTATSLEEGYSKKNYSKYVLDTGVMAKAISRIGNTVMYYDVVEEYKTTAASVLNTFGY